MVMTLMLVEDDKFVHRLVKRTFRKSSFRVIGAFSVREACWIMCKSRPDIILLDLNFPGECGVELLDFMEGKNMSIPVIAVTGVSDLDSVAALVERGVVGYIKKPFEPASLKRKVLQVFMNRQSELKPEELDTLLTIKQSQNEGPQVKEGLFVKVADLEQRMAKLETIINAFEDDISFNLAEINLRLTSIEARFEVHSDDIERLMKKKRKSSQAAGKDS